MDVQAGTLAHVDCLPDADADADTEGAREGRHCYASILLVFRRPKQPVPACMLRKYAEPASESAFLACITSTNTDAHGAAACMRAALKQCFHEHGVADDLQAGLGSFHSSSSSSSSSFVTGWVQTHWQETGLLRAPDRQPPGE